MKQLYSGLLVADHAVTEGDGEVPGTLYHVGQELYHLPTKDDSKGKSVNRWVMKPKAVQDVKRSPKLLSRFLIGRIEDETGLVRVFNQVKLPSPTEPASLVYSCRTWILDALKTLRCWPAEHGGKRLVSIDSRLSKNIIDHAYKHSLIELQRGDFSPETFKYDYPIALTIDLIKREVIRKAEKSPYKIH